ncbi:MAG: SCP2 sterol-binding domain-containing protein [Proteobacteria bacterium]|nr:SCP2 sterol-binding domain-containing protein [Pseudomonadota bacterium]
MQKYFSPQTPEAVFTYWSGLFHSDSKNWSRFAGKYRWNISGENGGTWIQDCSSIPKIYQDEISDVDFQINISQDDFLAIIKKELNPQIAVLEKRIRVSGKIKHSLRFNLLLDKLINNPLPN